MHPTEAATVGADKVATGVKAALVPWSFQLLQAQMVFDVGYAWKIVPRAGWRRRRRRGRRRRGGSIAIRGAVGRSFRTNAIEVF
jgi:hypothetical protein